MNRLLATAGILVFVGVTAVLASDDKPNPTGTWKWSVKVGEQTVEMTLKLKLEREKLRGTIVGRDGSETPIVDAKFKDGELSFRVVRGKGAQQTSVKYRGKVGWETIRGKTDIGRDGQPQERDWEAKRVKK